MRLPTGGELPKTGGFRGLSANVPGIIGTVNWESVYGRPASDLEGYLLETFRELVPASRRLLAYPQIPADVLAEARRSYLTEWDETTPDEWLIAMADPAVHGGGLHLGFAVTTRGVYWRNIGQNPGAAWYEQAPAPQARATWLDFGPAGAIDAQYLDAPTLDALVTFFNLAVAGYRDGVPAEFVRDWFVRQGADERGPYTEREMAALLRSGALLPYTSEARGAGMTDWAPMPQIDVVAEILADLKAAEPPPTPAREAYKRVVESRPIGPVRTRPEAGAGGKGEGKSVGQVIDGLINSVLKRFKG